jgi:hypothetical protein
MSYIPLATVTLGGSDADILFSNIPATFKDLVLTFTASTTNGVAVRVRPNSDAANGSTVYMYGTGSAAASSTNSAIDLFYTDSSSTYSGTLHFMDYAATDKHKTILCRSGAGSSASGNFVWAYAQRWASTSAISSLLIVTSSSTMAAGSTLSLYGVV